MTVMVCLDNKYGMLFGGRRQSRDKAVVSDILREAEGGRLLIAPYSTILFADCEKIPEAVPDFLDSAGEGDFCFVEKEHLAPYADKLSKIILYKWNRDYPSDFALDIEPETIGLHLVRQEDFPGFSHEKITKEVFER